MEKKKFNKKGFAFFGLISAFMILSFFYFMIIFEVPNNDISKSIKLYNKNIENLDSLNEYLVILDYSNSKILDSLKDEVYLSISKLNFLNSSKKTDFILNCNFKTYIWIDERSSNNSCLITINDFNKNISKVFEKSILENENNFNLNPNFNLNLKKKDGNIFQVDFENNLNFENSNSLTKTSIDLDLNSEIYLIEALEKILPKISDNNKILVPSCLDDISKNKLNTKTENNSTLFDSKLYCIKNSIINLIKENSNNDFNFEKDFNLKLSYLEIGNLNNDLNKNSSSNQGEIKGFIPIKLIFENKISRNKFDLGIILKDNIPFNLVSFSLSNYNFANGIVELNIQKPASVSKLVEGFIVLYSYQNFLDPSFNGYNDLKKILDSGKVPDGISKTKLKRKNNIDNLNKGAFYHIFDNSNLDISLLNLGINGFDENNIKKNYIFQIYNYDTKKFEKLDINKEIFVYIFAYDKNYNYNTNGLKPELIKKVTSKNYFSLLPLTFKKPNFDLVNSNFEGLENSIKISIPTDFYKDEFNNFANYDIYLFKNRSIANNKNFKKGCIEKGDFDCEYFSGLELGFNKKDLNLILTSSKQVLENYRNNNNKNNFSNFKVLETKKIKLLNNEKYGLLIVPVDDFGEGILDSINIKYSVLPGIGDFYYIGDGPKLIRPYEFKNIEIKDLLAPSPMNSITVDPNLRLQNNNLFLTWTNNLEDLKSLQIRVNEYGLDGLILNSYEKRITSINDLVTQIKPTFSKVEVTNIIPIDLSLNLDLNSKTQLASFIIN